MNYISKLFILWLLILLTVGEVSSLFLCKDCAIGQVFTHPFFSKWDSNWYTSIADNGYIFELGKKSGIVFLPLYPIIIRFVHFLARIPSDWVGQFISIVFAFLSVHWFYKLLKLDYLLQESKKIIIFWLLFPSSFFFISVYPTSLFIFLSILSYYFARKENWKLAGIFSALGALARPYGIFLMFAMLYEYIESKKYNNKKLLEDYNWIFLLLPLLSIALFFSFSWLKFGKPFLFIENQIYWGKVFTLPHKVALGYINEVFSPGIFSKEKFHFLVDLASLLFFAIFFVLSLVKKIRKSYLIFPVLAILPIIFGGNFVSSIRYIFEMPLIFIGPSLMLMGQKKIFYPYISVSVLLLVIFASLFVCWFPIY